MVSALVKVKVVKAAALTEKVVELEVELLTSLALALSLSLFMLLDAFFALLIVNSTFVRVWKNFICVCNLLELFFCLFRVFPVFVRVIFYGLLFESFLDLVFSCIRLYAHDFVIVILWIFWFRLLLLPLLTTTSEMLSASTKLLPTASEVKLELLSSNTWKDKTLMPYEVID